jgi:hypothetical protein
MDEIAKSKRKKCPPGTRKNKKTGLCEPKLKSKSKSIRKSTSIESVHSQNFNTQYKAAYKKLKELNKILKEICPNLSLSIEKMGNIPENKHDKYSVYNDWHKGKRYKNKLLLCLNENEECISSIILNTQLNNILDNSSRNNSEAILNLYKHNAPHELVIELDSKTRTDKEGRNYNTLLRAVVIIIGKLLATNKIAFAKITSQAINPVSAYLMIKFNAKFRKTHHEVYFLNFIPIGYHKVNIDEQIKQDPTFENVKKIMNNSEFKELWSDVVLSDENIKIAEKLFQTYVLKIKC